jgi:addiction module HigA family antidote
MSKHPGHNLRDNFMEPLGLTTKQLAKGLGVSQRTLGHLISGKRRLTLKMAAQLAYYFGVPAKWWLQMQAEFDVQQIENHPEWCRGIAPLSLEPALLLTPKGVLHLGESSELPPPLSLAVEVLERLPGDSALGHREVKLVRYDNGAVALVGDSL